MYSKKQQAWLKSGLCALCGSIKENAAGLLCSKCDTKKAQYARDRWQQFKQQHRCVQCGTQLKRSDPRVRCASCRKAAVAAQLQVRRNRVRHGLCACGRSPLPNKKTCELCTFKRIALDQTGSWENWEAIRDLFYKQNRRCAYTGAELEIGSNASLDHIIPKSRGGDNSLNNLQWVDKTINRMKGMLTHWEFIELIKLIFEHNLNYSLPKELICQK